MAGLILLSPAMLIVLLLLAVPLGTVIRESFLTFEAGRIGATDDALFTLENYAELLHPAYASYFLQTFRFAIFTSILSVAISLPLAYIVAHVLPNRAKTCAIALLIGLVFLNSMARVYAIQLSLGPTGFARTISNLTGISANSRAYAELLVTVGLLHFVIPVSALVLLGSVKNIDRRLIEAAQILGAPRWKSHLSITLPLCLPGILSAFLVSLTMCLGAFVVPLILGGGKVMFISNLIYNRFSQVTNYPSGSAVAMTMLIIALMVIAGIFAVARRRA